MTRTVIYGKTEKYSTAEQIVHQSPKIMGYENNTLVNNDGTFDCTEANDFKCTPTGDITINPMAGHLTVTSINIKMYNTGGHTITFPPSIKWVHRPYDLKRDFIMRLYTHTNGDDWYGVFIGRI